MRQLRVGADVARRLQAIHQRHLHVHQHAVELRLAQQVKRLFAIVGQADGGARFFQQFQRHLLVEGVVFHQQDARMLERAHHQGGVGAGAHGRCRLRHAVEHGRRRLVGNAQVGREPEGAAGAGTAVDAYVSTHQLGQLLADGQAQARAAIFARGGGVGLLEGLEEFTHFILRQADAVVAHFEAYQAVPGVRHHLAHFHGNAALFAELDGVIGVVDQHLPQAQRVAHQYGRQLRVDLEQQFQVLAGGARRHHRHQGLHHVVETEVDALDFQLARLDFRDVEDIVDDAQQMLAGEADFFQVIALARFQVCFEGQIRHADHAIHRCADFMAHVGQELALRQAGLFGHLLGLVQLLRALRHALFQMFIEFAQGALAALVIRDVRQAGHHHAHLAVLIADGLGIYGQP